MQQECNPSNQSQGFQSDGGERPVHSGTDGLKQMMKSIEIHLAGDSISLQLDGRGGGTIKSTLHISEVEAGFGAEHRANYNSAIDGVEAAVLAHACAGVNVTHPDYVRGLVSALEAISNQHS